jgi:hypothetical protein
MTEVARMTGPAPFVGHGAGEKALLHGWYVLPSNGYTNLTLQLRYSATEEGKLQCDVYGKSSSTPVQSVTLAVHRFPAAEALRVLLDGSVPHITVFLHSSVPVRVDGWFRLYGTDDSAPVCEIPKSEVNEQKGRRGMTDVEYKERADRLDRLCADKTLCFQFENLLGKRFADNSGWAGVISLRSALECTLYNRPESTSMACAQLRTLVREVESRKPWWEAEHSDEEYKAMAAVLREHPVWDIRKSDLTVQEQSHLAVCRLPADSFVWAYRFFAALFTDAQNFAHRIRALKALRGSDDIEGYKTLHACLCGAVTEVLENRWPPKQPIEVAPPQPVLHTCQMTKTEINGHTASQGPCGKPVHASAPNAAGFWYCEDCVSTLMESKNGDFREQKKREIEKLKSDFDRPFKPRYMIGTGDLHGPKL